MFLMFPGSWALRISFCHKQYRTLYTCNWVLPQKRYHKPESVDQLLSKSSLASRAVTIVRGYHTVGQADLKRKDTFSVLSRSERVLYLGIRCYSTGIGVGWSRILFAKSHHDIPTVPPQSSLAIVVGVFPMQYTMLWGRETRYLLYAQENSRH